MDDQTLDSIFAGKLINLPPLSSKIVRIFTSSTFTDTGMERNTLMAEVYPKIKEFCREKHGLEFQVVDMRWGIRDEATDDHMTTELCMREIRNCQRLSMGPNFVVFLCQKYGYRPIPTIIVGSELDMLKRVLKSMGVDTYLLDLWYRKDTNAVPNEYILQPISSILIHFLNKSEPKLMSQDQGIWWNTLEKLQKLLRKAAYRAHTEGYLNDDEKHNYFMSVTEREVINGLLNIENTKNTTLAFVRYINNINLQNVKKACNYIDIVNRAVDTEAQRLLGNLRDERVTNKIEASNMERYTVEWSGREGISKETHMEYLSMFLGAFYRGIVKLVDRAMRKEDSSTFGAFVAEILQHLHSCVNSVKVFYGREESLLRGEKYILGPSDKPLIIYGAGGSGKTSLLAKLAAMAFEWYKEYQNGAIPLLLIRFIGTSPDSSALIPLLMSLCKQANFNFNLPMDEVPDDLVPLMAYFKEMLHKGTEARPILLFLDSVDQLKVVSGANILTWLPSKIPKNCKIVLSTAYELENLAISQDYLLLRKLLVGEEESFIEVGPLGEDLATIIIKEWLIAANRDLNHYQWRVVTKGLFQCSLPIYVKLVFDEVCRWKSYSKPDDTKLALNVMDSIFKLFGRIEFQHGPLLVSHALGYITASKSGLSESELEDLISLDDMVLDDIYQYHMPPTRRIPPLLWTRIRNDLPNYFSEGKADGVSVLSWYHRQFRDAAKQRYFKEESMGFYYHSSIADYFHGIWGGGVEKPFRYTEMQRYRFNLKSKDGRADRKVPLQPLCFPGQSGKTPRFNLRKLAELPYHFLRSNRFDDLFKEVLFNYDWLYSKIAGASLQATIGDFEDASTFIKEKTASREILLVADALRLGGEILLSHPTMLAPQLVGRLLPEIGPHPNIVSLLKQCDSVGNKHCALIPVNHCMHTPGGPLKYSLEGHRFAVFDFRLTSDYRFIISISNKFVTWDLSTSDLVREVNPGVDGVLHSLVLSPDNRYAAAYTNHNQTVLLNLLTNELQIFENPLRDKENIVSFNLLDTHLVIVGSSSYAQLDFKGTVEKLTTDVCEDGEIILSVNFTSISDYSVILWSGNENDSRMSFNSFVEGIRMTPIIFNWSIVICESKTKVYACIEQEGEEVQVNVIEMELDLKEKCWVKKNEFVSGFEPLDKLELAQEESFLVGTFLSGFKLFNLNSGKVVSLFLPSDVRNIATKMMESNSCVLSKDSTYALAGVRKSLYVWSTENGTLLKCLDAHFGRIVKIMSLTIGNWNSVITSSMDKTVKVWNVQNIFEKIHVIDRHELPIESISISPEADLAAAVTRSAVGIWDLKRGKLIAQLSDSPVGAIVTHALITKDGRFILSAESGLILIWDVKERELLFKEAQDGVKQVILIHGDSTYLTVSKIGLKTLVVARSIPEGEKLYEFSFPIKSFKEVTLTCDEAFVVCPGLEKPKDALYIYNAKTGKILHKFPIKYKNFKEFSQIVPFPSRPNHVAIIDSDKGNIIDVKLKKFVRSILRWGGQITKDGKNGLYASARGGLELIELKKGHTVLTLIPKVAEGVFTVITQFNRTFEYVLYYHGGRKTIRMFRVSDGKMLANYRVSAELSALETSYDGKCLVVGTVDGYLSVLAIADPEKPEMQDFLSVLPSRDVVLAREELKKNSPNLFKTAARLVKMSNMKKKIFAAAKEIENEIEAEH